MAPYLAVVLVPRLASDPAVPALKTSVAPVRGKGGGTAGFIPVEQPP